MNGRRRSLLVTLIVLTAGCASTQDDVVLSADEQFTRALELFDQGEYRSVVTMLQAFSFNYPQDPRVGDARWLTAESYFESRDWATAAQEYLNFQRDFPQNENAGEALFKAGRSYQRMSLRPELDQRDTQRAINVYSRVLTEYPGSPFAPEARERRSDLRNKLAEKAFLNAEFYYDAKRYDAAEIYIVDLIENYPDSDWLPAAYALLAETYCKQGLRARSSEVFGRLLETFPDTDAASEVSAELPEECRSGDDVTGSDEAS